VNPTDLTDCYTPVFIDTSLVTDANQKAPSQQIRIPYNSKIAYFSGLSDTSTLNVNYNVWLERCPTQKDADLITMATPSAKYDPMALEIYALIMTEMPIGVFVKENGLGDWFAHGVASAVDYITGTTYASRANKFLSGWVDEKGEKEVVRSKPLPMTPKTKIVYVDRVVKSKPLPPIPQRKVKSLPPAPKKKN